MADAKSQPKKARDITVSVHDPHVDDPTDHPTYKKTRRVVSIVGNLVLVSIALIIFLPMLIGVSKGISNKAVWDPYTGQSVYAKADDKKGKCIEEARRLLALSATMTRLERRWAEPYRAWKTHCRKSEPSFHSALETTRSLLRKKKPTVNTDAPVLTPTP